jgi:hypothetical protein
MGDDFLVLFVLTILFFGMGAGAIMFYSWETFPLGQMICDEQYGAGNSTYDYWQSYSENGSKIVSCRTIIKPQLDEFDSGNTRLLG